MHPMILRLLSLSMKAAVLAALAINFSNCSKSGTGPNECGLRENMPAYTGNDSSAFFFPTAFTPNGDGINDVFKCFGYQLQAYSITVFNGLGKKLFESDDINSGWNGTHKGSKVKDGKYRAEVTMVRGDGNSYSGEFDFLLISSECISKKKYPCSLWFGDQINSRIGRIYQSAEKFCE